MPGFDSKALTGTRALQCCKLNAARRGLAATLMQDASPGLRQDWFEAASEIVLAHTHGERTTPEDAAAVNAAIAGLSVSVPAQIGPATAEFIPTIFEGDAAASSILEVAFSEAPAISISIIPEIGLFAAIVALTSLEDQFFPNAGQIIIEGQTDPVFLNPESAPDTAGSSGFWDTIFPPAQTALTFGINPGDYYGPDVVGGRPGVVTHPAPMAVALEAQAEQAKNDLGKCRVCIGRFLFKQSKARHYVPGGGGKRSRKPPSAFEKAHAHSHGGFLAQLEHAIKHGISHELRDAIKKRLGL